MKKSLGRRLASLLVFLGVLLVWDMASKAINKELFLPSPMRTFEAVKTLYLTDSLFKHLGATFGRVSLAILITAAIALPLGMAIVWCKPVNIVFGPIVRSLRYIPTNVFSPLLVLLLGIDETMKITFLVITTFFAYLPVVTQTCSETNEKIKETAYTMGFSYIRTIFYVLLPYLLPSLIKALITTYGTGWNSVIIAEVNNTQYGLAHLIYIGSARGRTATVYAAIVIIIAVSFVFDKLANFVVRRVFKWRFLKEDE